jgi:hypothetical protein
MPRDRKAIAERKRKEGQGTGKLSKYNAYGFIDPTAYEAIKNVTREEQRNQASRTRAVKEREAALLLP